VIAYAVLIEPTDGRILNDHYRDGQITQLVVKAPTADDVEYAVGYLYEGWRIVAIAVDLNMVESADLQELMGVTEETEHDCVDGQLADVIPIRAGCCCGDKLCLICRGV
jgi:hypothetical protein